METKTYSEKLKDPRWQKKRLKILERDKFQCKCCDSTDKTLHVHHIFYLKGYEPWDYSNSTLITLCKECHQEVKDTDVIKFFMRLIFEFKNIEIFIELIKWHSEKNGIDLPEIFLHIWNIKSDPQSLIDEIEYLDSISNG